MGIYILRNPPKIKLTKKINDNNLKIKMMLGTSECDQCMGPGGVITGSGHWVVGNLLDYLIMKYPTPFVSVPLGNVISTFCSSL